MKQTLVIVTIVRSPRSDMTPLLLEHLPEEQILRVSLLDGLSAAESMKKYASAEHERTLVTHLPDGTPLTLSASKVEEGMQQLIWRLEDQGAETILLLGYSAEQLRTHHAVLLEPDRIVPPLIKAIVDGQQAGIMVSAEDPLQQQAIKWRNLRQPARFAVVSPYHADDDTLIDAALQLQEQGADVVVLDSPGYHQRHRDFLQKLLGIPVLLAKMAAELLA